jgi:mevalonate kinase
MLNSKSETFFSNGKLLLTGEYLVLDGALSLAVPTRFGQSLCIKTIEERQLVWKSLDKKGNVWFEYTFDRSLDELLKQSLHHVEQYDETTERLIQILKAVKTLNPNFLITKNGFEITTKLEFPKNWGLGTSSTLINNIAQWAHVDAYKLLEKTFGGSGYDIACAQHDSAITYQLINNPSVISSDTKNDNERNILKVDFNPSFKDHLYFVHLNQKQNSRDGIAHYKANKKNVGAIIEDLNTITAQIINCNTLEDFSSLITKHEGIIASVTNQVCVKERLFHDFDGAMKSLGAWGGDFILVSSRINPETYFKNKGYHTLLCYDAMVLV